MPLFQTGLEYRNFNIGDISIMLKDSKGFEHLMPNFSNWTKF